MCTSEFASQSSWDLGMYLPSELKMEDYARFQSPEILLNTVNFNQIPPAHRMDPIFFDPINDDVEASSALSDNVLSSVDDNSFDMNELQGYFDEISSARPHQQNLSLNSLNSPLSSAMNETSNMSPPSSPSSPSNFNIKKFLVFDDTTGRERRPLLHEFIRLVLEHDEYSHIAEYIDRKQGIFKLHRPKDIAELWKQVKGRNSDNSRSIL